MNILLIGCGTIGNSLLKVWSEAKLANKIVVVQPSMASAEFYDAPINFVNNVKTIPSDFKEDLLVLALKPQQVHEVLATLKKRQPSILVSLLAATPVTQFAEFPVTTKIIRIMPNIAIKTGNSVNLAFTDSDINAADEVLIEKAFNPAGKLFWLDTESQLDALTLISGSGPAYFLLLAELLLEQTKKYNVDAVIAQQILQQTMQGTADVAKSGNFNSLIAGVTSSKGVTAAALEIMRPKMQQVLTESLQAARTRLEEIINENSR